MPRRPLLLAPLALAAAALLACGGSGPPAASAPTERAAARTLAPPALCGRLSARTLGHVQDPAATEISGLVLSRRRTGVLWMHNDSGDRPRVIATRLDGSPVADLEVRGAEAVDWEDLAIAGGDLLLADIGDNASARASVDVFRIPEPQGVGPGATAPATRLRLRYPDGAHDAETLLADPRSGELAIVTKSLSGSSGIYVARPSATATTTLRLVGGVQLGLGGAATGGDVSADGRIVVVRTYTGIVVWRKAPGETLARALRRPPACNGRVDLGDEGQGEALALTRGGGAFYTVPEGAEPAIRRYAPTRR